MVLDGGGTKEGTEAMITTLHYLDLLKEGILVAPTSSSSPWPPQWWGVEMGIAGKSLDVTQHGVGEPMWFDSLPVKPMIKRTHGWVRLLQSRVGHLYIFGIVVRGLKWFQVAICFY